MSCFSILSSFFGVSILVLMDSRIKIIEEFLPEEYLK